jgi:hypothetical protein
MRKIIIYTIIPALLLLQGCIKDKGNYAYEDINEIAISNVKGYYEVLRLQELESIIPILESNIGSDETNYAYKWVADPNIGEYVLSEERNLENYVVTLPEGNYEVQYRITDLNTGVRYVKRFELSVKNPLSTGWLMMREDLDGSTRIDMRPLLFGQFDSVPDVLTSVQSALPRPTGPVKICRFPDRLSQDGIAFYLVNKSSTDRVRDADPAFSYDPDWNVKYNFISEFDGEEIGEVTNMVYDGRISTLMTGMDKKSGKHSAYYYNPTTQIYWARPINTRDEGLTYFNVSREFANVPESNMGWIVFDDDSLSFYRVNSTRAGVLDIPVTPGASLKVSYKNMGKKLKKMLANPVAPGATTPFIYAIMEDTVTHKHWILRSYQETMVQENWQEMDATTSAAIAQATAFATGGVYTENVYYAANGKVYAYNISENKSYLMLDKGSETITYLGFVSGYVADVNATATENLNIYRSHILVASHSSENIGTLERYQIPARSDQFVFAGSRFTGVGKIVDVAYKN